MNFGITFRRLLDNNNNDVKCFIVSWSCLFANQQTE